MVLGDVARDPEQKGPPPQAKPQVSGRRRKCDRGRYADGFRKPDHGARFPFCSSVQHSAPIGI